MVPRDEYHPLPRLSEVQVSFDHDIEYFSWDNSQDVIVDAVPLIYAADDNSLINPCSSAGDQEIKLRRNITSNVNIGRSKCLEEMKSYFYMPMTRESKEMNVGGDIAEEEVQVASQDDEQLENSRS